MALFLLECDSRRDPWEQGTSCLGEGFRRGALPKGSGGREIEGELEKTTEPWGLQLRPLGMGMLGETHGTTLAGEQGGHPLGISTQSGTSSSEQSECGKRTIHSLIHDFFGITLLFSVTK